MSKAKNIFNSLVEMAAFFDKRRYPKIGQLLERLSEKDREELSKLKSSELNDRIDGIL